MPLVAFSSGVHKYRAVKDIRQTGEFKKIDKIAKTIGSPLKSSGVEIGIGDDAAVVAFPVWTSEIGKPSKLLLCTDAMIEGVHFDLSLCSPSELGHKALAATLSDLAAMNGRGLYALFSLALPRDIPKYGVDGFLESFYQGASALARSLKVDIVGGDLSLSNSGIFIDVVGVGETHRPISRQGAKPGDLIAVSGSPGTSAAGLHSLQRLGRKDPSFTSLHEAHLRPNPRFDLLSDLNLVEGLCTSLIDISDGLASELHHIASSSSVGVEIEVAKIPFHPDAITYARSLLASADRTAESIDSDTRSLLLKWALSGGEDYELIATFDPESFKQLASTPHGFTLIGRVVDASQSLTMIHPDQSRMTLDPIGYNHFI
jgi:thiamine-monophosphate kinase